MFLFERLCAYSIIQENRPTPHPSVTLASGALVLCTTSYNTVLWGCASVSYVWGIAACLATVYIVGLSLNGKPIKKACWVVASVCACYAAYAEQPAATLLGFLLIFILIFLLFRQPIPYFVLVISLLTLINSIVNLIAPGNQIRDFTETISRWPDFGSYTLIQKLALGCSYTLDALTGPLARYVFIAVGFLILNLHINRQWVSTVLCILILGYFGCACLQDFFPVFRHLFNFIPGDNLYGWGFPQLLCTGLFLFVWFGLIALISIGDTAPDWFGGILGLAVFANLLIMGFSPTIYASAERPFYVSNLLINLLSLRFFFRFSIVKKVPYWIHWGLAILICLYAALTLFRSIF